MKESGEEAKSCCWIPHIRHFGGRVFPQSGTTINYLSKSHINLSLNTVAHLLYASAEENAQTGTECTAHHFLHAQLSLTEILTASST